MYNLQITNKRLASKCILIVQKKSIFNFYQFYSGFGFLTVSARYYNGRYNGAYSKKEDVTRHVYRIENKTSKTTIKNFLYKHSNVKFVSIANNVIITVDKLNISLELKIKSEGISFNDKVVIHATIKKLNDYYKAFTHSIKGYTLKDFDYDESNTINLDYIC